MATDLLRNYAAYLENGPNGAACICSAGLHKELAALTKEYTSPESVLLLAWCGDETTGCVAVKRVPGRANACEMKRLWVKPAVRGLGVGRSLAEGAIAWARERQANVLLLDTQPEAMPQALALWNCDYTELS